MKQITLFILFLFAGQLLIAQTVITNNYNLSLGDTYQYDGYEEVSNIEPGDGGTNQTWDFGQVTGTIFIEGEETICVDPSTTPFADTAAIAGANICVRNVDEDISPYQFFDCNNNQMDLLAMGFVASSNASFSTYTNALTAMDYPCGYGDDFNDTWEVITFHIDFGFYMMRDSAAVLIEADATGTITTPTDTYQNCLRIKRTTVYYSWFRFEAGGEWTPSGPYTDIVYEWYAPGIKVPVMIVDDMDGFPDYSVRYLVDYNFITDITTHQESDLCIFPNPAKDILSINSNKVIENVRVYSLQGKEMISSPANPTETRQLNISYLSPGYYILTVHFEDDSRLTRKIIKQ